MREMESRESFNSWVHKFECFTRLLLFALMSAIPVMIKPTLWNIA